MNRRPTRSRLRSALGQYAARLAAATWLSLAPATLPVLALLAPSCSTPSVPLPPPVVDVSALGFSSASDGQLVLSGKPSTAHEHVRFFIVNRATGDGVITTAAADGSFTAPPLAAVAGDVARLYFEDAQGEASGVTCLVIVVGGPLFGETCL